MRALVLAVALSPAAALAWESVCVEYPNPVIEPTPLTFATDGVPCDPASGPNTARQRWIGPLDEHRRLWEEARIRAGLPEAVSANVTLTVFTSSSTVGVGAQTLTSLQPVAFSAAQSVQMRVFTPGELTQLPDFSYALWDWALGHETCPLSGVGVTAEKCHDFATHMGPVNSNHFVPQAGLFYAHYHALALSRAQACRGMKEAVGAANEARFDEYLRACESEALALEAVGQHYLQDAWSSGHMWERWGSPDLTGFIGATTEEQRERAVLVALVSGLIHGSRAVLQRLPEWTSFDVNDAMCAPHDAVRFVAHDGMQGSAVGDDYLALLASQTLQSERFFSCSISGILDVYETSGQIHGPIGSAAPGWQRVDPLGFACFGQRVTNEAILAGMGIQLRVAGQQFEIPLDGRTVGWLVPKVALAGSEAAVDTPLRNGFRLELLRMTAVARVMAKDDPEGTQLATGRLGSFLGALPNGHYPGDSVALASYVDPPLPWPSTPDASPESASRALALARLFHRSHAADWCAATTSAELSSLQARASDASLDASTRAAACSACTEIAVRHLRIGTPAGWDTAREPLCHSLVVNPAYVYRAGAPSDDPSALARAWCGC
jgi:hypothetical protein